jgi:hypothetical protein
MVLWSGVFFLPHGEAKVLKEEFQTLREELKQELRKELREEVEKEFRENEQIRQKIRVLRQEIQEQLMIPCRKASDKQYPLEMRRLKLEGRDHLLEKGLRLFEDEMLKLMLKEEYSDKDVRMAMYFVARQKCENQFDSEE